MGFKVIFNAIEGTFDFVNNGYVIGPAVATDNAIARYDGTTGKLIQDSKTVVQDGGAIESQGFITRRNVTEDVTVHSGESWDAPSLFIQPGVTITLESDAELLIGG